MKWIKIDNHGFNVEVISAMSESEFLDQYKDHKPLYLTEKEWLKWCKEAYSVIISFGSGKKTKKEKPAA